MVSISQSRCQPKQPAETRGLQTIPSLQRQAEREQQDLDFQPIFIYPSYTLSCRTKTDYCNGTSDRWDSPSRLFHLCQLGCRGLVLASTSRYHEISKWSFPVGIGRGNQEFDHATGYEGGDEEDGDGCSGYYR